MNNKLIELVLNLVGGLLKSIFIYGAGKKSKENEINKSVVKNVTDSKKIEESNSNLTDDDLDAKLSRYKRK